VQAIFAETEGNPFFVEEVFQHLREDGRLLDAEGHWLPNLHIETLEVPEGVRLVIGRRLERVSAECRALLTAAAVIGPRFDLAVLEALGDASADAMLDVLEEAERAGLVIAQQAKRETRYTFAHELIRQTLLGTLSVPRRLRRHLRTAEAIEKVYAGKLESRASELAYHFFQSGSAQDEEKTTRYLLLAGKQALSAGAFDEALAQVEKAFSILETPDERRHADLLWVKASAVRGLGKWRDAQQVYLQALDRYEALGAQAELLSMTCMLAEMLYYATDHAQTATLVARVLKATEESPSTDRARLLALGGSALAMGGNYADGLAMSDRALAMATVVGDEEVRAQVLSDRAGLLQNFGRIADAAPVAAEAFAVLAKTGKRWAALWAGTRHQWSHRFLKSPREAVAMGDDLLREATGIGHLGAKLTIDTTLAAVSWMLDPHVDIFTLYATKLAVEFAELGTWSELSHMYSAWDHFERDDRADPGAEMDGCLERFGIEPWQDLFWADQFWMTAHTHPHRALTILEANAGALPVPGQPAFIGAWDALRWVLVGLVRLGERARAAALYPLFLEMGQMGIVGDIGGLTEVGAGIAAAAGARWEDAEFHFESGSRIADEHPHVAEQADVRYWHAWMLLERRAVGDVERARVLLNEAMPMFERSGRKRRLRECGELLQACVGES
jgi:tetratricopeptide (TPR) repeat protein